MEIMDLEKTTMRESVSTMRESVSTMRESVSDYERIGV